MSSDGNCFSGYPFLCSKSGGVFAMCDSTGDQTQAACPSDGTAAPWGHCSADAAKPNIVLCTNSGSLYAVCIA